MLFLPIVQRELRVAARRQSTFRIRWWTTLVALGVSAVSLATVSLGRGRNSGASLFSILTCYAFGLCLLAGVFFTAQSLTAEKQEGTLGLLFTSSLKGYDVVLGKFAASSLNSFYGLLALLPVTALPLLLGGVTGAEFWRMAAALTNALFYSLAAGLCVSACMRNSQQAMGNTLGVLILAAAVLPGVAAWSAGFKFSWICNGLAWLSPTTPFAYSGAALYPAHRSVFWGGLLASHLVGWAFLGLASGVLPRAWRERGRPVGGRRERARRKALAPQSRVRADLLSANPVRWLSYTELGIQWRAWGVVALWAIPVGLAVFSELRWRGEPAASLLAGYAVIPFGFLLKVLFALQVCRFFAEGRNNRTLELLLCTPLTNREIVRGQMQAVWRSFAWPLTAFVALLTIPVGVRILSSLYNRNLEVLGVVLSSSFLSGVYIVRMGLDLLAICWFGMGLALTMKKPALAPALTILFVLILPSVLCWADALADLVLIAWGASRCQRDLRRLLAEQYQASAPVLPAPLPAAPPAPAR